MNTPTERGRFISLEGLEGVGKTTNRQCVMDTLTQAGIEVTLTREPGGTPLGESLRQLILHDPAGMQPTTELLMVVAARLEHVHQVIEPALSAGRWVLSDRFTDASYAYQGGGRRLGAECIAALHRLAGIELQPDLTLLLDMPIAEGLARMQARGEPDRIEREAQAFFERARAAYRARAAAEPARVVVIDAGQPLASVQQAVRQALSPMLTAPGANHV